MGLADIGVYGMATMGSNLARNFARHGHTVAIYNRTAGRTEEVVKEHGHEGDFRPAATTEEFVAALERPRRVIIMVQAGGPTDAVIEELATALEPGDVIVEGGNAHFEDTRRREAALRERGLHFVGAGISGGEDGALNGPSIMPGGPAEAYASLGPLLESISAKVDGMPCCVHVGPDGAGHFVKMIHNGIEYADMQLISESYDLLRQALGFSPAEIAEIFRDWNEGELESYLIEITAEVLAHTDPATGKPLVDVIVDRAEQKGSGRWTAQSALDLGVPATVIVEAISAHALARHPEQRTPARAALKGPNRKAEDRSLIEDVRLALHASKIVAYAQGFDHITAASEEYGWGIDRGAMAAIWRGGCIIRAPFLDKIRAAYDEQPDLPTLLVAPAFSEVVNGAQDAWRRMLTTAITIGVPAPGFSSALAYYDGLRRERLPAALIQGLRDYFGAGTYRRVDREGFFHTDWSGATKLNAPSN
jgi:6-phosphogluconate dehydrogenase